MSLAGGSIVAVSVILAQIHLANLACQLYGKVMSTIERGIGWYNPYEAERAQLPPEGFLTAVALGGFGAVVAEHHSRPRFDSPEVAAAYPPEMAVTPETVTLAPGLLMGRLGTLEALNHFERQQPRY